MSNTVVKGVVPLLSLHDPIRPPVEDCDLYTGPNGDQIIVMPDGNHLLIRHSEHYTLPYVIDLPLTLDIHARSDKWRRGWEDTHLQVREQVLTITTWGSHSSRRVLVRNRPILGMVPLSGKRLPKQQVCMLKDRSLILVNPETAEITELYTQKPTGRKEQ